MSNKGERQSLSCQGLTFLPPDAVVPLFHMEGSVGEFSKILSPLLADREPHYKEALNWLQFAFIGDPQGQYVAPANTGFSYTLPVEGGALFLPALDCLQTLYPEAYTRGNISTSEGAELSDIATLHVKLSARTHLVTAILNPSPRGR